MQLDSDASFTLFKKGGRVHASMKRRTRMLFPDAAARDLYAAILREKSLKMPIKFLTR